MDVVQPNRFEKYNCGCGGQYVGKHHLAHKRTKRHQRWIKNKVVANYSTEKSEIAVITNKLNEALNMIAKLSVK